MNDEIKQAFKDINDKERFTDFLPQRIMNAHNHFERIFIAGANYANEKCQEGIKELTIKLCDSHDRNAKQEVEIKRLREDLEWSLHWIDLAKGHRECEATTVITNRIKQRHNLGASK